MSELDCRKALERMNQFLDQELCDADAQEIREHLAACEPCLDDFDADQVLKQLVHRCCSESRAPDELRDRIRTSLARPALDSDG
ncbi:mycothiol system anti-sigma-R factor [Propioniferax innocua]|uniref:Mycothiol system anti-sigma-R factor n=1 Tax=Propioniferax innocua TaxID=1753 RepID=A0A542ZBI9_9ACTN|nr:mycothiol system anti-sigma-R factor [Propioniferax innocua]TQL57610.1 mycothiol system anti-sigma-R factor [Propioniferax innocua]